MPVVTAIQEVMIGGLRAKAGKKHGTLFEM
jgi:hypothetical protein